MDITSYKHAFDFFVEIHKTLDISTFLFTYSGFRISGKQNSKHTLMRTCLESKYSCRYNLFIYLSGRGCLVLH